MINKLNEQAGAMKRDWDDRARENAKWYINTVRRDQSDEEFGATGLPEVQNFVLGDPVLTRRGDFKNQRLLEIGCGIGRMTRHLAGHFAEVHGTDVSAEMIEMARERLGDLDNVYVYETSGVDFAALPSDYFDVIFSVYVFQHVPTTDVIHANIHDALRVLKPGGLFKFQTCSITAEEYAKVEKDTWTGASFTEEDIRRAARDNGARLVSFLGLGTQYCWTILQKPGKDAVNAITKPEVVLFGRSDDPREKSIPNSGDYAFLTIVIDGPNPNALDANNVIVDFDGEKHLPCYVGWVGENFAAALNGTDIDRLTQINIGIPKTCKSGETMIRAGLLDGEFSDPFKLSLIEPPPVAPRINLINNAVDGGIDVHATGEKSVFRVFANAMDETATPETVRIFLNDREIIPETVSFVPANGVHMTVARMPEGIQTGEHQVRILFRDLLSNSFPLKVLK
ncbi:MAG: class I SAM-dependent methyltransferase [Acidobacteriota bacterium]|nr:MAG: class I SAM-dependent methyltransferase [Acidobacteriota bacterium]